MLQQRYLATYIVAATLFGNISPHIRSTLWQRSRNFPGLRFHNFSLNVEETLLQP